MDLDVRPEPPRPTTRGREQRFGRRADIQGLRAVAVLLVVAFHGGLPVDGGFVGVDVFFVISGFVITSTMLREIDSEGRLSFAAFYSRRVRRILPALALMVAVVAVLAIGAIGASARQMAGRTGVAASFFVSNILLAREAQGYFDVSPALNPFLHLWSLSVEEQFYFVFPTVLMGAVLLSRRLRSEARMVIGITVAVIAAGSFALCVYTTGAGTGATGSSAHFAFYMAPARAWEFAMGALLSVAAVRLARVPRPTAAMLGYAGAALVVVGAVTIDESRPFPGTAALVPVIGAALLLAAGTATRRGVSGLLGFRPLARIGDVSYSWYLWHWPLIVFAGALWPGNGSAKLMAAAASFIPAWLSYRWVERPIHTNVRWRGWRALMLATVCVTVPVAACLALLNAPLPSANAATKSFLHASVFRHADRVRGCNLGIPIDEGPKTCSWTVPQARGTIALLGDSNAGHFTEPVALAANRLGYDFSVATYFNCPLVDVVVHMTELQPPGCRKFVNRSLQELESDPPALVVLASATPIYLQAGVASLRDPVTGTVAASAAAKTRMWSKGLERVLRRLQRAGVPTLVVHTVPQWLDWNGRGCAVVRVYHAPQSCGATQNRTTVNDFRRQALIAERRAVSAVPAASAVDFIAQLCSPTTCATNRGDEWLYRDGRHLSVVGATQLTDHFATAITAALRST